MDQLLEETGVVPVVVIDNADDAVPLAKALVEGGLPIIEVTLRTQAATAAIENIAKQVPEAVIGAGTVLSVEHLQLAHNIGAQFIVSPGLNRTVVEVSQANNLPIYPGIATASELQSAWNMGLRTVKFFPAELAGGVAMIKALASVFRDVKFMPTGGVAPNNLREYLSLPTVTACGGSWLAPSNLLTEKNFTEITRLAAEAKKIAVETRASE
ncbi:MAG: bifunctional 4-hydroxy-2-oxoglutarate aldolase/2-dehydro-3-deoxy-phosphogluconate aldolase [Pseudomonadales bacterium]|nr:bifunctional 4-hydroxy-2-oxoglutarate aldolase/2-dehydro-3-deoxy-phosphogluconate aldolase [Pseudomonadales bacterium]